MKFATFLVGMLVLATAQAAAPGKKDPAVRLESIPGGSAKRVILTARAAERLGIEMGKVGEQPIVRKQMVGGLVVSAVQKQPQPQSGGAGFGGFGRPAAPAGLQPVAAGAAAPAANEAWLLVTLSQGEWERVAKDRPARILPLATRDKLGKEVLALPSGMPPLENAKRSMLHMYYVVPGNDHGLTLNQRMRVELQHSGSDEKHKVVPYGAVYYDAKGAPWVYVNPQPLAFERRRIGLERIMGNLAVLSEGPPVGTAVVTVGAALLYGAEIFGK